MLSQSVTLTSVRRKKRVTRKQSSWILTNPRQTKSFKPLILKAFKKLARLLLYLQYNKNNNAQ